MALATRALATIGSNLGLPPKGASAQPQPHQAADRKQSLPRLAMSFCGLLLCQYDANLVACLLCPPAEVQPFQEFATQLEDFEQLNALHWDEESGEYRDWGNHTGDLVCPAQP
jgi:hypothetical protein